MLRERGGQMALTGKAAEYRNFRYRKLSLEQQALVEIEAQVCQVAMGRLAKSLRERFDEMAR